MSEATSNDQAEEQHEPLLRLSVEQVENCAFGNWYRRFVPEAALVAEAGQEPVLASSKGLCTIASRIVPLPADFEAYLASDGIVLPRAPEGTLLHPHDPRNELVASEDTYDAFGDVDWDADGENAQEATSASGNESHSSSSAPAEAPCFPALELALDSAIRELGSEVFVKLDWTSPQDGAWVTGTLKCSTPGEVYMLLKASDFCQHDLHHAFDACFDRAGRARRQANLVLRRWSNLNKAMEFRCFAYHGDLLAIAQRHPQTFHAYLALDKEGGRIREAICDFFFKHRIAERFPDSQFSFDVYVDRAGRVWLVDFAPLATFIQGAPTEAEAACSAQLAAVPPHPLISWAALRGLVLESDAEACQAGSGAAEEVQAAEPANGLPAYFVVQSSSAEQGDVTRSHRVPIELVTGELTQDIVDQAKRQLDTMALDASR